LYARNDPAGAIVSIDPATGAIAAMAGVSPGTPGNEFNLATMAQRQAGSTFKPIVLAAAVEQGMNPWATRYLSAPFYYEPLHWRVGTYNSVYAGPESAAAATIHSDNTVYARLALDVGPDSIVAMAQRLGVRAQLQSTPSLALGTDAGKTGTTDNDADAWFCGYAPSLEATVWIGYPRSEAPMLDVHGSAVSGPTLPATAWRLYMEEALHGAPNLAFPSALSPVQFVL